MTHAFRCPKSLVFSAFLAIFLMLATGAKADNEIYGIHSEADHTLTIFYGERPGNGIPCENAIINDTVRLYKKWNISGITKIVFDQSVESARPTDCSYWFYDMKTVESFEHLDYLNTSEVTNMHGMFSSCFNISNLDLRGFNTEKVIDMGSLFRNCNNLESLNISGWNTERVTKMNSMFYGCEGLTSIDVSKLNTANVTDMSYMFYSCKALANVTFSTGNGDKFNTGSVTDMSYMFYGCSGLTSIDISKFNTESVTNMDHMFNFCGLETIDVSKLNTANVTNMSYMFSSCKALANVTFSTGNGDKFNTGSVTDMSYMFGWCEALKNLNLSVFNTESVTTMAGMFSYCRALKNLDVSGFDTRNVENMASMFELCLKLTTIDVSKFNTEKVTDMGALFRNCQSVTNLDISNFNTKKVTNMASMFDSCPFKSITFGKDFVTDNVTNMMSMFYWCTKLESIDLSNFNTGKVTNMWNMFSNCQALKSITFGNNFVTNEVTNMHGMFSSCHSITSLDLRGFNTEKVSDMGSMFRDCRSLESLNISGWNTEIVTDMSDMFSYSKKLETLDLTSFNTESVTNMSRMFDGCLNLISVFVSSDKWETETVNSHNDMFNDCTNLRGEKCAKLADFPGYNYDKEFANINNLDKCLLILDGYKIIFNSTLDGLNLDNHNRPRYTYKLNGVDTAIEGGQYIFTNLDFDFTPEVTATGFDFVCWWGDTYTTLNGHETIPENDYSHQTITIPAESRGNFYYTAVLQYPKNSVVTISEQPEFQTVMKYKYPIVFQKADINLAADIYSEGDTINPLGTPDLPYKGTFNGNSHTISGITTNAVVSSVTDVGTLKVAQGSSMFGVLDNDAVVENLNIGNVLMYISFEDNDNLRTLDELTLPLFADVNAGQIKNCTFAPLLNIDDTNLKNKAKINLTLVGNNDNGEENTDDQALMENIAVFLPNVNLLYKTVGELMSGTTLTQKELMYRYWCYFANYMQAYKEDIECPTFNSFVKWWEGLTDSERAAFEVTIEFCDFDDDSSLSPLAESFIGWYTADAQNAYRIADKTIWVAYRIRQNAINGNEVAIVATQNLCKSPGKGRVHKVCSAPKGKSNKDGQLNPYDEEYMEYTLEEFASGIASYWLNHDGRGLTGNYNKMWSQSLLHPILATAKNGYILKLNVTKDDEAKSLTYPDYAKEGSTVKMYFTDKPAGVLVAGSPLSDDAFMADYFKFEMPQTPDGESVVNVSVGFASVPTAIGNTEAPASAVRIIARGNSIVVENATNDIYVFDAIGHQITHQAPQAQNVIDVQNNGVYVVKCGTEAKKVVFHF